MNKKYTWPCGCVFITEPMSFYQWHPCNIHAPLLMENVLIEILKTKDAIIGNMEGPELTITIC